MSEEIQAQTEAQGQVQPVAEQAQAEAVSTSEESTLPDQVSERTKAEFEKLKQANKELKAQLEAKTAPEQPEAPKQNVFESLRPDAAAVGNLSTQKVEEIAASVVDENGYVDVDVLNKALRSANEAAKTAQAQAQAAVEQLQRYEETRMVQEAYKQFPELDPYGDQYDESFWKLVRTEVAVQMMNGSVDLVKAAETVNNLTGFRSKKQESGAPAADTSALDARSQASSQEVRSAEASSLSDLRKATSHPDRAIANVAIAERLKAIGI
jgi:hypothetical protein